MGGISIIELLILLICALPVALIVVLIVFLIKRMSAPKKNN